MSFLGIGTLELVSQIVNVSGYTLTDEVNLKVDYNGRWVLSVLKMVFIIFVFTAGGRRLSVVTVLD